MFCRNGNVLHHLLVFMLLTGITGQAAGYTAVNEKKTVWGYQRKSPAGFIGIDALIRISVGFLASILFVISAMSYYRDGRRKFLMLSLAFLVFAIKGVIGLIDLFFPAETPLLIPVSDSLDFIILALFFIAVVRD